MLKRLVISLFQSHRHTELEFHKGVNVIVGDPQSGKSAILRAFLWLTTNRPLGFRFHSTFAGKGEKETSVVAEFDDCLVLRKKGDVNTYVLGSDKSASPFSHFGDEVPEPILKALNLAELNVQPQLEPFFLITSSPQEIARAINRVTRVEKVDEEWLPKLTKRINLLRADERALQKDIDVDKERLEELADLPVFERDVTTLEGIDDAIQGKIRLEGKLNRYLGDIYKVKAEIRDMEALLKLEGEVESIDVLEEQRDTVAAEDLILSNAILVARTLEDVEKFASLEQLVVDIDALHSKIVYLSDEESSIGRAKAHAEDYQTARRELEKTVNSLVVELQKEGRCPLCLTTIDKLTIKKITEVLRVV